MAMVKGRTVPGILGGIVIAVILLAGAGWIAFIPLAKEPPYAFVLAWGGKGAGEGRFDDPTGVAVAGDEVFVSDARNGRIQVFGLDGRFRRAFGKPGSGPGALGRPMNLTVRGGALYVAEYFNDRIQVFALDGTPLRTIGKAGAGPGAFNAPGGVAVGPGGALYVADFYNHRIQKITAQGAFVRQWGRPEGQAAGSGGGVSFNYPTDVAIAADGRLFVADGYNDRVLAFNADGSFSHKWGGPFAANIHGPFNGWFATVTGIAIGPQGNVFVADFYNHRVQKFAADGTFLTSFGRKGGGPGEFNYPISVALASDGSVYVADYGNNRVSRWRPR